VGAQAPAGGDVVRDRPRSRAIQLGATAIVIMNISGADPLGLIRTYGEHVLPELRKS
jgi:hypothetical protein